MKTRGTTGAIEQRIASVINTRCSVRDTGQIRNCEMLSKSRWSQGKIVVATRLLANRTGLNRVVGEGKKATCTEQR